VGKTNDIEGSGRQWGNPKEHFCKATMVSRGAKGSANFFGEGNQSKQKRPEGKLSEAHRGIGVGGVNPGREGRGIPDARGKGIT